MGAVAALTMNRRVALLAAGSVWLANRIAGFAARRTSGLVTFGVSFLAAFTVYEGGVVMTSLAMRGGLEYFTVEFVARNFAINAVTFAILLAANRLAAPAHRNAGPVVELAANHA
jgi:hypothetical protein